MIFTKRLPKAKHRYSTFCEQEYDGALKSIWENMLKKKKHCFLKAYLPDIDGNFHEFTLYLNFINVIQ